MADGASTKPEHDRVPSQQYSIDLSNDDDE